jgi:acyl transferase domain-containing protein
MTEKIAVIGFAGRFPGADDVDALWQNLLRGEESLTRFGSAELAAAGVPREELRDPDYVPVRGVLRDADRFDAELFGYSAREAALIDPQQRVLLECAWHALEHAGHGGARDVTGVFVGTGENSYLPRLRGEGSGSGPHGDPLELALSNAKDHAATRIAHKLGLTGPAVAVQSACSTSLVAAHMAVSSLRLGECDLALAGGASVQFPQTEGYRYSPHGILSPDGRCRPFADDAHGTVVGAGAAVVVLKRLQDALAAGDCVHAVILGSAVNNDGGRKAGYTAPSVHGQREVILRALKTADINPLTIGYLEAHGTGTELGDGIEVQALTEAFREHTDARGFCAIGSVKANLGHLDAAAGVTGLIKAVLAVREGVIPASINCKSPHQGVDWAGSPFLPPADTHDWPPADGPRRAAVSSFGMGGTNAHAILEQAPPPAGPEPGPAEAAGPVLLPLSAASPQAAARLRSEVARRLDERADRPADLARTLQAGRAVLPWRLAVAGTGRRELSGKLAAATPRQARRATFGLLFPGQGAQYPGMARGLHAAFPVFRERFEAALASLGPELGGRLRQLLLAPERREQDRAALDRTALAQPALFVLEYALCGQLEAWGLRPRILLGHSVGEITAACVAGAIDLPDALALVAARGRLMDALPTGAMLAVFAAEAVLAPILPDEVQIAAVNGPEACVVAGPAEPVRRFAGELAARGVNARRLRVSHAFHSAMMEPIVPEFRAVAEQVAYRAPAIRVVSNLTGGYVREYSADYWVEHLLRPVRFADGLALATAIRNPVLLEAGPGRALSGFARAVDSAERGEYRSALPSPSGAEDAATALLEAVGAVWSAGADVDWSAFGAGRRIPLPLYPFERTRHWIAADRRAPDSAAPADEPAARPVLPSGPGAPEEPAADPVEAMLRSAWHKLLGVLPDGPEADFFALGGDSLLAVRLIAAVRREFGVQPGLEQLLESKTFAAQAELVRVLASAGAPGAAGSQRTTNGDGDQ